MSDEPAAQAAAPEGRDAADAPWGEDAASGRTFARWNLLAFAAGALALGAGAAVLAVRPRAAHDPTGLLAADRWAGHGEEARYEGALRLDGREEPATLVRRTMRTEAGALRTAATWEAEGGRRRRVACRYDPGDPRRLRAAAAVREGPRGDAFARLASTGAGWRLTRAPPDAAPRSRRLAAAWLEDQLPLLVRTLDWEEGTAREARLLGSLLAWAPGEPELETVRLRSVGREQVTTPAGTFDCVRVAVEGGSVRRVYWVAREPGRPLVRFEDGTGRGRLRSRDAGG